MRVENVFHEVVYFFTDSLIGTQRHQLETICIANVSTSPNRWVKQMNRFLHEQDNGKFEHMKQGLNRLKVATI